MRVLFLDLTVLGLQMSPPCWAQESYSHWNSSSYYKKVNWHRPCPMNEAELYETERNKKRSIYFVRMLNFSALEQI